MSHHQKKKTDKKKTNKILALQTVHATDCIPYKLTIT